MFIDQFYFSFSVKLIINLESMKKCDLNSQSQSQVLILNKLKHKVEMTSSFDRCAKPTWMILQIRVQQIKVDLNFLVRFLNCTLYYIFVQDWQGGLEQLCKVMQNELNRVYLFVTVRVRFFLVLYKTSISEERVDWSENIIEKVNEFIHLPLST